MISIMSETLIEMLQALGGRHRQFDAGRFLFHAGDPVRHLFVVEAGEVHLLRHRPDGASLVLQRAAAGSLLAEASLFAEQYHCDAVAVRPGRALAVDRRAVRAAFANDVKLADEWSRYLAQEVQATRARAELLALRTVAERLDAWLASRAGVLPPRGGWKSLASEIAVSPEALYREIARRCPNRPPPSDRAAGGERRHPRGRPQPINSG